MERRSIELPSLVTRDRTRGNGIKFHQGKFRLAIRFFIERVFGFWNRLPREVATAPLLSEFNECLDDAPSHRV